MKIYKLISENMSNVGGPMWNQSSTINWERYFPSVQAAKKFAEKDYKKEIKWARQSSGRYSSGTYDM